MIVPHIAIASSLLLAANNPHIWEGITAQLALSPEAIQKSADGNLQSDTARSSSNGRIYSCTTSLSRRIGTYIFRPIYETKYRSAWMWDRGSCKALWVAKLAEEYPQSHIHTLRSTVLNVRFDEWIIYVYTPAMILLVLPSFLGGLTR